jgi:hypothetical protein
MKFMLFCPAAAFDNRKTEICPLHLRRIVYFFSLDFVKDKSGFTVGLKREKNVFLHFRKNEKFR